MDKARVTVVAAHRFQAGQAGFTGTDLSSNQQQESNKVDADREIAAKCEQLGQQSNLHLMQNAFQMQQW